MGTIDTARAVAAGFDRSSGQSLEMLQAAGRSIADAQAAFLGGLGRTTHPSVVEVEARCAAARQKVAEAVQALDAARRAARTFRGGLS